MELRPYTPPMPRKPHGPKPTRPTQGARLLSFRRDAGLTQTELARLVGETQANVSFWERTDKPPRSDVLPKMAKALGISIEDLLGETVANARPQPLASGPGPVGHVQKVFEEVRKLPRRQQLKVIEIVEALVDQFKRKAS